MSLLHTKPEVAAQERMVDDGNGKVEVRLARATLGPWDSPAAEEGSLFCRYSTILCSLRGLELAGPHNIQESERHTPTMAIT